MRRFLATALFAFLPARAFAQSNLDRLDKALMGVSRSTNNDQLPQDIYRAIAIFLRDRVFQFLISGAITVAVLFLMYGAMQYFTAYGDENRATNAKKTVTYAVIGLLISFMAMGISALVQRSIINNQIMNNATAPVNSNGPVP